MSYLLTGLFQVFIVNTQENTLISHAPTGTYPVKNKQNRLDLACEVLEQNAFTFPIEIPIKNLSYQYVIKTTFVL